MNIYAFAEIPDKRLDEISEATLHDTSPQSVIKLVLDGWPQDEHNIAPQALPYFDMRDSLKFSFSVFAFLIKPFVCDLHAILLPLALDPVSLHASTKVSLSNSDAVSMLSLIFFFSLEGAKVGHSTQTGDEYVDVKLIFFRDVMSLIRSYFMDFNYI